MKTTLYLDDRLMREVKQRAAATGRTMSSMIETALRNLLRQERKPPKPYRLEFRHVKGDRPPDIDIADRDQLYERMEGRR